MLCDVFRPPGRRLEAAGDDSSGEGGMVRAAWTTSQTRPASLLRLVLRRLFPRVEHGATVPLEFHAAGRVQVLVLAPRALVNFDGAGLGPRRRRAGETFFTHYISHDITSRLPPKGLGPRAGHFQPPFCRSPSPRRSFFARRHSLQRLGGSVNPLSWKYSCSPALQRNSLWQSTQTRVWSRYSALTYCRLSSSLLSRRAQSPASCCRRTCPGTPCRHRSRCP